MKKLKLIVAMGLFVSTFITGRDVFAHSGDGVNGRIYQGNRTELNGTMGSSNVYESEVSAFVIGSLVKHGFERGLGGGMERICTNGHGVERDFAIGRQGNGNIVPSDEKK